MDSEYFRMGDWDVWMLVSLRREIGSDWGKYNEAFFHIRVF